jgi:acetyltransferase-like isoleucine patch superfamily enzyme
MTPRTQPDAEGAPPTPTLDRLFPLVAGARLPGDWFTGAIPANIEVGSDSVIDSSFCFKHYRTIGRIGLRVGSHVTIWRTGLSVEEGGLIEIGDYSYLANASLACAQRITIGARVFVAGGVTIVDSDFHPLAPAARLADTIALSPLGDRARRPRVESSPVVIQDDVWIGHNATILKGVTIGQGALLAPGAVVVRDVEPGTEVAGNPAAVVRRLSP